MAELRDQEGVVSVHESDKTPHLFILTYDPAQARSQDLLRTVNREALHAELEGM
ncbi:MAG: hypothetical protein P8Z67_03880 [Gammaproteobacteria bacterium]